MKLSAIICFILSIPCGIFYYWGLHTVAGNHAFDEMAGIVPFAAGVLGGILVLVALLLWWLSARAST